MMPHIYNSLRGYPSRWVHSLDEGLNLTVTELLECMDCAFGDMCKYNTMICSLYEIRQKEGVLAFLVPSSQYTVALNGVHHDAGHQGQQRTLALAQEHFWWPMIVEDCKALVRGCSRCHAFEGVIPKAPLCPIRGHTPLELVHVDFTNVESTMELNKPPSICLLYTSPSPRDATLSRMPSSA